MARKHSRQSDKCLRQSDWYIQYVLRCLQNYKIGNWSGRIGQSETRCVGEQKQEKHKLEQNCE